MVKTITSLGSGVYDWLVQRVTAVVMASYVLCLALFFVFTPTVDFATWQSLFQCVGMKVFTIVTLFALFYHAWAGLWIVSTDYIKCSKLRLLFQVGCIVANLGFFFWGAIVVWGV